MTHQLVACMYEVRGRMATVLGGMGQRAAQW
jgi:hypothetical protein